MNLSQAMTMTRLRETKPESAKGGRRMNAVTLAKNRMVLAEKEGRAFDGMSADEVADKLFASSSFVLMEVPMHKLASPGARFGNELMRRIMAEGAKLEPIVIDANVHKAGKSAKTGYYPPVIVVDGKERFEAAMHSGEEKLMCWVGELAAQKMDIRADHQMSSDEIRTMLNTAITADLKKGLQSASFYIKDVYPMENYCIYSYNGTQWRQKYVCDMDARNVILVGPPKEVVQRYVDKDKISASRGRMESAIAIDACGTNANCGCGVSAATDKDFIASKDGKKYSLKACNEMYQRAAKAGKVKVRAGKIEAKGPPGWEGTIKHMKDHGEIDNPWALAWWMDDEGYTPHH